MIVRRRPRSQVPVMHYAAKRFRRGKREAWRKVTWQEKDTYTVDGLEREFDDPVDAIRASEERRTIARRKSDGLALNYYFPTEPEQ